MNVIDTSDGSAAYDSRAADAEPVDATSAGDATAPDAGAATKVAEDAAVDTLTEALAVDLTVAEGKLTLALALAQTRAPLTL